MTEGARAGRNALLQAADRELGARLRELRRARGLTQTALGERLGVASQQVAKYESGENALGASRLWLAAGVLGVAPDAFFKGLGAVLGTDGTEFTAGHGDAPAADARSEGAVRGALQAGEDGAQLAELFRRISSRRTRELLLTLSRELAGKV